MGNSSSQQELSAEAQLKIYRQLKNEHEIAESNGVASTEIYSRLQQRHNELTALYSTTSFKCPTVRFGRTNIQMPILTCGGMRMQETWNPPADMDFSKINKLVQSNFESIVERSMKLGINHFETARGYGTSEVQYGEALKKYSRESYILQTKVVPKASTDEFRTILEKSFSELQLKAEGNNPGGYVDLFTFHGLNIMDHIDWINRPGGNMEVIKEYQAQGKIKHIGFSSHGSVDVIVAAIETGVFDFVNLHYHFIGSYVSTGTGPVGGNMAALKAAQKQDMGVFIISPTDKGGALYQPPKTLYKACLPLTPIAFNSLYLWSSDIPIHTLVIGAARPEDFDEHIEAAMMYEKRKEMVAPVEKTLRSLVTDQLGADHFDTWCQGLLDPWHNDEGIAIGYIYWLWWITKYWGMYSYSQQRYSFLEGNIKPWDDKKTAAENRKGWSWVSGLCYRSSRDAQIRTLLAGHPKADHVMNALKEAHTWFSDGGCLKRGSVPAGVDVSGWANAYDLQSDKPYCDRKVA